MRSLLWLVLFFTILGSVFGTYHIQWHRGTSCNHLYSALAFPNLCEPLYFFYALDGDVDVPMNSTSIRVGSSPYYNSYCRDLWCSSDITSVYLTPGCHAIKPMLLGAQSGELYEIQSIYLNTQ